MPQFRELWDILPFPSRPDLRTPVLAGRPRIPRIAPSAAEFSEGTLAIESTVIAIRKPSPVTLIPGIRFRDRLTERIWSINEIFDLPRSRTIQISLTTHQPRGELEPPPTGFGAPGTFPKGIIYNP